MNYPYIVIQLINGKIKVACNKDKEPNIFDNEYELYLRKMHGSYWEMYIKDYEDEWQQNHEVFDFYNQDEIDKVFYYLTKKLGFKEYEKQLINGIQVTCIEIKDDLAWFKEETKDENLCFDELFKIFTTQRYGDKLLSELKTKYQITRK